jgi:hypothetical protein
MAADPAKEQEHREEAERLAKLPRDVQRQAIAIIRAPADDPKLSKRDREEARNRADALERHLRSLSRRKREL